MNIRIFSRNTLVLASALSPLAAARTATIPTLTHHLNRRSMSDSSKAKPESEWQAVLSREQVRRVSCSLLRLMLMGRSPQFRVLRGKGTEAPGTGKYDKWSKEGVYSCAGCGTPLYKSTTKFDSGCGWPAFFDGTLPRRHHRGAISHAQQASSHDCDQPSPALSVAKSTAAASCPRQRSFATLVEGTWATFSKEKVSLRPVSATNNLTSPSRNRISY